MQIKNLQKEKNNISDLFLSYIIMNVFHKRTYKKKINRLKKQTNKNMNHLNLLKNYVNKEKGSVINLK